MSFSRSQKGRPGLYGAVGQAVPQLVGDYLRPRQRLPRLRRLCDGEVADAYVAYLPARDELLHGLHRLLDGELVARPVQLVKVDVLLSHAARTSSYPKCCGETFVAMKTSSLISLTAARPTSRRCRSHTSPLCLSAPSRAQSLCEGPGSQGRAPRSGRHLSPKFPSLLPESSPLTFQVPACPIDDAERPREAGS